MSDLTAIDILINPDEATLERARKLNARMRKSFPDGFALDATHQPHITMLQRYVRTADLDHVYDAVAKTVADTDIPALSYEAVEIKHVVWGKQGGAIFLVKPNSKVLDFQANLLANVTPFVGSGGTPAAFVTDQGEEINQTTMDWVSKRSCFIATWCTAAPAWRLGASARRRCRSCGNHNARAER